MKQHSNYTLILSDELRNIFKNINDKMSRNLLFMDNNEDYSFPYTLIDISSKDDMITYAPSKVIIKNKREDWSVSRNEMKIGRFISRIGLWDQKDIELFVNKFKSEIKMLNNLDNFEIVEGRNLKKYYFYKYYSDGGGSLNKSCMRHEHCQPYFNFYVENKDKVKLVILKHNNSNKILGRALLWKIDEPKNLMILDRIYTTNDSDQNLFIKLARKNGWYYKQSQKVNETYFVDPKTFYKVKLNCKIYLKPIKNYEYYPYLDSFYYYDTHNFYITNNKDDFYNNKYTVRLRSTDGRELGNENFVFDYYNNDYIRSNDSVHCYYDDMRIHKKDAVKIGTKYYTPNSVRFSEYDGKIYSKYNTIWSNWHLSYMNKDDIVKVFLNESEFDFLHINLKGDIYNFDEITQVYYMNSLLIKDNNKYYLKKSNKKRVKKNKKDISNEILDDVFKTFIEKIDYNTYVTSSSSTGTNLFTDEF
jgi:hypothetical protein